jgi:hypothetical protein
MIDKRWWWMLLPIFLVSLVVHAPASLLPRLLPESLALQGGVWQGTLWQGQVRQIQWQRQPLEQVSWTLSPWRFLLLQAGVRLTIQDPAVKGTGYATLSPRGFGLTQVVFQMDATRLPVALPKGVRLGGIIRGAIESAEFRAENKAIHARAAWKDAMLSTPWTAAPVHLGDLTLNLQPGDKDSLRFAIQSGKPLLLDVTGKWVMPKRIEATGTAALTLPQEVEPVFRFLTVATEGDRRTLQYQGSIPGL